MGRVITYLMAAVAGVVIAVIAGMPALRTLAIPEPDPSAVIETSPERHPGASSLYEESESAQPAAQPPSTNEPPGQDPPAGPPSAPEPNAGQTILQATVESGSVTAVVNGRAVENLGSEQTYDLSPFVRPGRNSILLRWTGPVRADLRVTRLAEDGSQREAGQAFLTPAGTMKPGEQRMDFYL